MKIAIFGHSGSGKSTLGAFLGELYGCLLYTSELLSLVGSTTVTGIVIISLMIPCIYKLGVERSRLAIMVVFLVPMGVFLWYLGSGLDVYKRQP